MRTQPSPPFYITTAIAYPNGAPHIGHAYEYISSDAIARFKRLDGFDVFFMTGTDEHGQKMQQTAAKEGITSESSRRGTPTCSRRWTRCSNISYDRFIRTTDADHQVAVQGDLGADGRQRRHLPRHLRGLVLGARRGLLHRGRDDAAGGRQPHVDRDRHPGRVDRGVQLLLPALRVPGQAARPVRGAPRVHRARDSAQRDRQLRLGRPQGPVDLAHHLRLGRARFRATPSTSCTSGSTRSPTTSPASASRTPTRRRSGKFWPANLHIIGKDITRFHTVYWPAFLMSAGIELPKRVFVHGFLYNKGEKMSKSVGNVVDPLEMVEQYGLDAVRFFLLREISYGQDGSYSHEAIVTRMNADLANELGNLAQRSLSMVAKNCDAQVPDPRRVHRRRPRAARRRRTPCSSGAAPNSTCRRCTSALEAIWHVLGETNRYFSAQEPWVLRKTDPARMATVLYVTLEVVRIVGILVQPVMPDVGGQDPRPARRRSRARQFADIATRIVAGTRLPAPAPVFPRYVEDEEAARPRDDHGGGRNRLIRRVHGCTFRCMYVEEFAAGGLLTAAVAEELSWKTAEYSSRIFVIVDGRRALAQCVPQCWDELKVRAGTPIAITTEGGHALGAGEDAQALREFGDLFRELTAPK